MWRKADPEFAAESLRFLGTAPAFRGYVQPLKGLYPPTRELQPTFQILSARSPDGRYNLIFDWYLIIEGSGDEVDISGEPDSAPLLLDLKGGTSNQFDTCGTPCAFSWGVWLSPKVFALGGWEDEEPMGHRSRGRLKVYSLADSSATTYVTRPVAVDARRRYQAAWESWVDSKFHALTKATPRR